MIRDDAQIREVLAWDAFTLERPRARGSREAVDIPPPSAYLPETTEARIMLICSAAAGDLETARKWFDDMSLSDVYKWLAIRTAQTKGS